MIKFRRPHRLSYLAMVDLRHYIVLLTAPFYPQISVAQEPHIVLIPASHLDYLFGCNSFATRGLQECEHICHFGTPCFSTWIPLVFFHGGLSMRRVSAHNRYTLRVWQWHRSEEAMRALQSEASSLEYMTVGTFSVECMMTALTGSSRSLPMLDRYVEIPSHPFNSSNQVLWFVATHFHPA